MSHEWLNHRKPTSQPTLFVVTDCGWRLLFIDAVADILPFMVVVGEDFAFARVPAPRAVSNCVCGPQSVQLLKPKEKIIYLSTLIRNWK